jgi:ABC-type uncharacterized transport system permease subunit
MARDHRLEIGVVGARRAPCRPNRTMIWLCLLVSGGLAGLAGQFEIAGPIGQLIPVLTPGYGFTAIIVAFLGRLHPLGIILSGLLMALSYIGENAQVEVGVPQVTGLFQGPLRSFPLASDFWSATASFVRRAGRSPRIPWRRPDPAIISARRCSWPASASRASAPACSISASRA